MDKCIKVAALYVATLKAISLIHQSNHWTASGEMFYEEHLLFERIYKSAIEDLDMAAEKFIGLFGESCLDYNLQIELLGKVLSKYKNLESSPVEMSLAAEKDFIKFSSDANKCFEEEGRLSLGLDDMIAGIAS